MSLRSHRMKLSSNRSGVTAFLFCLAFLCVGVWVIWPTSNSANASESSWLGGEATLVSKQVISQSEASRYPKVNYCEVERVSYIDDLTKRLVKQTDLCVTHGDGFRIAEGFSDGWNKIFAISIGSDVNFYKLTIRANAGLSSGIVVVPGTTKFMLHTSWYSKSHRLRMYDNLLDMITSDKTGYILNCTEDKAVWGIERGVIFGWGISRNGKYVAYGKAPGSVQITHNDDVFIEDVATGERGFIGKAPTLHYYHAAYPANYTISDDGRQVVGTSTGHLKFWEIDDGCTIDNPPLYGKDPCDSRAYSHSIHHGAMGAYPSAHSLRFNADATEISYIHDAYASSSDRYSKIILRKPGVAGVERLGYLALGDSYSSGEGDIVAGVSSYYLAGTEKRGECHLSSRSYPYTLSAWWGLSGEKMKSVACSGAKLSPDYIGSTSYYDGQNHRLADTLSGRDAMNIAKQSALQDFKPGVTIQLDFIEKYRPKVVTLTGGGNDIGFADLMKYCASPSIKDSTCRYADTSEGREELMDAILYQRNNLRSLVEKINQTSPDTVVYIIGYPQFIATSNTTCLYNAASLNDKEKLAIREIVIELNGMLESVADETGAAYVDIEDSLEGGQLCQGKKYVTGLHDLTISQIRNDDVQNSFHPNANGHIEIARAIHGQLGDFDHATKRPTDIVSSVVGQVINAPIVKQAQMVLGQLVEERAMSLSLDNYTFSPGSDIVAKIYSDETTLGTFEANDRGGFVSDIVLPSSIEPGRHVLVLSGLSYSGEPITLYQFIDVFSANPDDLDGDGIPNDEDACLFLTSWYDEETGRDVCRIRKDTSSSSPYNKTSVNDAALTSHTNGGQLIDTGQRASLFILLSCIFTLIAVIILNRQKGRV